MWDRCLGGGAGCEGGVQRQAEKGRQQAAQRAANGGAGASTRRRRDSGCLGVSGTGMERTGQETGPLLPERPWPQPSFTSCALRSALCALRSALTKEPCPARVVKSSPQSNTPLLDSQPIPRATCPVDPGSGRTRRVFCPESPRYTKHLRRAPGARPAGRPARPGEGRPRPRPGEDGRRARGFRAVCSTRCATHRPATPS